jgi:hypothetical protein
VTVASAAVPGATGRMRQGEGLGAVQLAVTIDTEADGQWDHGAPLATRNVGSWPAFQELCERHGVAPTYLVTTEIINDDRACELLTAWSRRGAAEIGAHLHPWTTPPFADRPGLRFNDPVHAFPSQLPGELLGAKIATLTEQFSAAFGAGPTSYRAGRFGFDQRSADFLAAAGYQVDSSVSPLWSWRRHEGLDGVGGPDFRGHSPRPFLLGDDAHRLVEIPVTILPTYAPLRRSPALLAAYQLLPVRAVRKLLLSRWLRPQPMWLQPDPRLGADDLAAVWRVAARVELDTLVMMFHSSELMPGGSPFRPDAQSVRDLLACLDGFFAFVNRSGGEFATLTPMAAALLSKGGLKVRAL